MACQELISQRGGISLAACCEVLRLELRVLEFVAKLVKAQDCSIALRRKLVTELTGNAAPAFAVANMVCSSSWDGDLRKIGGRSEDALRFVGD